MYKEGEHRKKEEKEEEKEKKEEEEDEDISRKEIIIQLRKLKKRKAPGENGIENEAWRLMSKDRRSVS